MTHAHFFVRGGYSILPPKAKIALYALATTGWYTHRVSLTHQESVLLVVHCCSSAAVKMLGAINRKEKSDFHTNGLTTIFFCSKFFSHCWIADPFTSTAM